MGRRVVDQGFTHVGRGGQVKGLCGHDVDGRCLVQSHLAGTLNLFQVLDKAGRIDQRRGVGAQCRPADQAPIAETEVFGEFAGVERFQSARGARVDRLNPLLPDGRAGAAEQVFLFELSRYHTGADEPFQVFGDAKEPELGLTGSRLAGCRLTGCGLTGCRLAGCRLTDCGFIDLRIFGLHSGHGD
ncbi:pentapeptide repeat-containing protein [Stieleria sp.]|uniref:pentapeptide repeat-containing protein n=1 Tax=Stieleria sp. TaxID=2795976 RepID=UPI0035622E3E